MVKFKIIVCRGSDRETKINYCNYFDKVSFLALHEKLQIQ